MDYWITALSFALVYGSLAISYNISLGYVGVFSLAHAAFFSIGAYAYGYLATHGGGSAAFLPGIVVGVTIASVVAVAAGSVLTRMTEHYVMMGTFAMQVIFTALLANAGPVTGGVQGIAGIPVPVLGGLSLSTPLHGLVLSAVLVGVTYAIAAVVLRGRIGIIARACRDEPSAAAAAGISSQVYRVGLFALAAALAAVAGVVYASLIGFIDPTTFTIHTSIVVLSMVVIGGVGNPLGALVGGLAISLLPVVVQEFDVGASSAAAIQQILFGAVMVGMIIVRPEGLFPEPTLARADGTVMNTGVLQ